LKKGPTTLLSAKTVKERLDNVSDMTLWRLTQDPASGFPAWIRINGRKFLDEDEFEAWIRSRPRQADDTPSQKPPVQHGRKRKPQDSQELQSCI
jgi:hypothetical protein